jgi:hypothetical protein
MARGSDMGKTQIIVAVIGVSGVLGTALIANWDKLTHRDAVPAPQPRPSADGKASATVPSGEAENLSQAQQRAFGGATDALNDVADKIENAGLPDLSGTWTDQFGQTYVYEQSGADYSYSWFAGATRMGGGTGHLTGRKFAGTYQFADGTSGPCRGEIDGDQATGTCDQGGKTYPMLLVR